MKSLYREYAALYNFSYMSIGALTPLISQYLKHAGFTGAQIGVITASGTFMAIFASVFWGRRYNNSLRKHEILILLCLSASAICMTLEFIEEFYVFALAFGAMYFFQAPVMSLTDAFTVESRQGFGGLRAWGALGFALGIFFAGFIADRAGIDFIFWIYTGSFCLAAVTVAVIKKKEEPGERGIKKDGRSRRGYLTMMKNRKLLKLIVCAFFWGGTNVANNTYFSFLYIEGGGSIAGVGAVMLLMVGSEVPFMAWCGRLSRKYTMEKLVLYAMMLSVIRFTVFGLGVPWWALMLLAFSQGAVNGILLIEFVRYAAKLVDEQYRSLAISAYYVAGSNLSTIFCQLVGGRLLDCFGAGGVYMFFALFNLCGVFLYVKFHMYAPRGV